MNVSLPADLAEFVEQAGASGDYGAPSDVVRDSPRRLPDEKAVEAEKDAILRRKVQRRLDDARAGRFPNLGISEIARDVRRAGGDEG